MDKSVEDANTNMSQYLGRLRCKADLPIAAGSLRLGVESLDIALRVEIYNSRLEVMASGPLSVLTVTPRTGAEYGYPGAFVIETAEEPDDICVAVYADIPCIHVNYGEVVGVFEPVPKPGLP